MSSYVLCIVSIHGSFYINTSYLKCQSQILIVWIRVPSTTEASSTGNTNWQPTHCLSSNERHRTHNTWEEVFDPRLRPMSFVFAAAMHRHSTVVVNGRGNESNGRISKETQAPTTGILIHSPLRHCAGYHHVLSTDPTSVCS